MPADELTHVHPRKVFIVRCRGDEAKVLGGFARPAFSIKALGVETCGRSQLCGSLGLVWEALPENGACQGMISVVFQPLETAAVRCESWKDGRASGGQLR